MPTAQILKTCPLDRTETEKSEWSCPLDLGVLSGIIQAILSSLSQATPSIFRSPLVNWRSIEAKAFPWADVFHCPWTHSAPLTPALQPGDLTIKGSHALGLLAGLIQWGALADTGRSEWSLAGALAPSSLPALSLGPGNSGGRCSNGGGLSLGGLPLCISSSLLPVETPQLL